MEHKKQGRGSRFGEGFRCGLPVMLGYFPVSFAFAVTAVGSSLPWPVVLLISLTNFTSAGQAAGAGLLITGAPLPEIGVTVLIINIRYLLMSLSLSQKLTGMPLLKRLLLANGVTDEIFFLAMQQEGRISGWFFAGLAAGPYLGWGLGTLAGTLAGEILPPSLSSALGIALFAMFVAIVVPQAKKSLPLLSAALLAVGFSCLFRYLPLLNRVPSGWALILSAVAASALCAVRFPLAPASSPASS
ncbi:MAG: AzlC family ABC transporter permease [Clostridiales bacterium]|nr:AzlC family ABC transporter permease [Clostridiales bacterium]